jgi:hypothetical protein
MDEGSLTWGQDNDDTSLNFFGGHGSNRGFKSVLDKASLKESIEYVI